MRQVKIKILAFYKFVTLPDFETLRESILQAMFAHEVKGTIIVASEGINGGIAGSEDKVDQFVEFLHSFTAFSDLSFKISFDVENPYDKAKVKLRKEIVTLGVEGVNPSEHVGAYLSPTAWNQKLQEDDVLLIDTRNTYEVSMGTFKGAINPQTKNFRDFPAFVEKNLLQHKDKKVLMCCTGGIRCEKSTAYLLKLGFKEVYHLEGGILNYLESIPEDQSMWEGDCFVFDNRVAIDHQLNKVDGAVSTKWDE